MVTMGLVVLISHSLLSSETSVLHLIGAFLAIFLASFGYEWCCVHSSSLTRHKRAHFDEANILETYQPRARLEGHLFVVRIKRSILLCPSSSRLILWFQPDPPTPGPVVKIADGSDPLPERTASEKAAFNNNRDSVSFSFFPTFFFARAAPSTIPVCGLYFFIFWKIKLFRVNLSFFQHYANMYQQALQMAKEQEAMEKAKEGAAKKSGKGHSFMNSLMFRREERWCPVIALSRRCLKTREDTSFLKWQHLHLFFYPN